MGIATRRRRLAPTRGDDYSDADHVRDAHQGDHGSSQPRLEDDLDALLIDVDGPLTEGYVTTSCDILRELKYAEAYPDAVKTWDPCDSFAVSTIDRVLYHAKLCEVAVAYSFLPRPGALEFLSWARTQYRVVALTTPLDGSPTWAYDRGRWLVDQLGFVKKNIVFAWDKSIVPGILVDDKPSHVEGRKSSYLWDTSYNKGACPSQRVTNFDHLRHRLEVYNVFSQR